ncbi:hypothetical protein [Pseudoduganella umbonata]|uniref:Uncharacterized protein n=1 Tax=Pseudoduganella umbonata TaxID=864828 RepID=A0A4P8HN37_9BURK|nr:hypothetical protein [Pseudoduganella umbonata]MBB3219818.1 hypothetical protein [Pseudoduganella umbonata]QCP09854.1 hypothetical protein FCL38_05010 [Pseudoduganella umbonata]
MRYPIKYLLLASALVAGGLAWSAAPNPDAPAAADANALPASRVEVKGIRSPARWPYRAFLEGLDTFDDKRSLAPNGVLTFVLQPAAPLPEHATVAIDSEAGREILPRSGMYFAVPRIDRLDRRDAELTVTVRDTQFAQDRSGEKPTMLARIVEIGKLPVADVRSPGLPDNVFRLGDLRLACQVTVAVFKDQSPWWFNSLVTGFIRKSNWCEGADSSSFSPRAAQGFIALTMRDGAREERFTYDEPRYALPLPAQQRNWSDETLVTIEPAPDESTP